MRARLLAKVAVAAAATALLTTTTTGPVAAKPGHQSHHRPSQPVDWLEQRVLNMAHSGGEREAPTNTMYAFKRAVKVGSDMIELDIQSTKDNRLVVIHNATVDETTNGTGYVKDLTLRQLRRLDAAHWFVPDLGTVHDQPASAYTLRGARYGKPRVPGYRPNDFAIPTLAEVFHKFRRTPINIEIKGTTDADTESYKRTARLLAKFLAKQRRNDIIVGSFNDDALGYFHGLAPKVPLSAARNAMIAYFLTGAPLPEGTVALQVPAKFSGIPVVTRPFVERAHGDGYAVHVWFSGSAPDDEPTYNQMLDACVDGIMPARPALLERILDERNIERPGQPGVDPCA